ncbi:MAG: DNA-binding protein [Devosia sp.]
MTNAPSENLDLLWGATAIAAVIGKTPRATFHLLEKGQIPSVKIGAQWVASRKKLREHFEGEAA